MSVSRKLHSTRVKDFPLPANLTCLQIRLNLLKVELEIQSSFIFFNLLLHKNSIFKY